MNAKAQVGEILSDLGWPSEWIVGLGEVDVWIGCDRDARADAVEIKRRADFALDEVCPVFQKRFVAVDGVVAIAVGLPPCFEIGYS